MNNTHDPQALQNLVANSELDVDAKLKLQSEIKSGITSILTPGQAEQFFLLWLLNEQDERKLSQILKIPYSVIVLTALYYNWHEQLPELAGLTKYQVESYLVSSTKANYLLSCYLASKKMVSESLGLGAPRIKPEIFLKLIETIGNSADIRKNLEPISAAERVKLLKDI